MLQLGVSFRVDKNNLHSSENIFSTYIVIWMLDAVCTLVVKTLVVKTLVVKRERELVP